MCRDATEPRLAGGDAVGELLDLPPTFVASNQVVVINVGGAQTSFTLDAKGRGVNGFGNCRLAYNKKLGLWQLTVKLGRVAWRETWANHGLTNETVQRGVTLPVTILLDAAVPEAFTTDKALLYRATAGKSGTAR